MDYIPIGLLIPLCSSNPRDGIAIPSDRGISDNLTPGTLSQGTGGFYPNRATNTPMFQGSESNARDGITIPSDHSFAAPGPSASAVGPARKADLPRELPPRLILETPASAVVSGNPAAKSAPPGFVFRGNPAATSLNQVLISLSQPEVMIELTLCVLLHD